VQLTALLHDALKAKALVARHDVRCRRHADADRITLYTDGLHADRSSPPSRHTVRRIR
jgi:hypothetical protein